MINDGFNDNSVKICDEYAKKYCRVRVFHKENGGVSSARNLRLDNAKGKWITFVDSGDWIDNETLNDYLKSYVDLTVPFMATSNLTPVVGSTYIQRNLF